ncbi:Por secretion system C-terminal sorting domain-containing protein [Hymenobacter psychrotolerans DSM 18569]|uniref:Por secretion system C-terminal sorting domain-containing protein n=2 Tax=Hymenobacter psychrotolerans TaxID=344998 RepID=A0A1M6RRQ1_9BACT|nr:Por secretion system C-terminal sorting domain-containing protein [Hymenobacter psychrotolerans DSM 18569]
MTHSFICPIALIILWLGLSLAAAQAQTLPSWLSAQQVGGLDISSSFDIATDAQGNIYQTGNFIGSLQVGGITISSTCESMYVIKYDAQGTPVWAKHTSHLFPGGTGAVGVGFAVAADAQGNVYVLGIYSGFLAIENEPLICPGYNTRVFLAKYDAAGNFLWVRQAGDDNYNRGMDLAVDNAGNVIISGYYSGTTLFAGNSFTSAGGEDIFLAKYTAQGDLVWVKSAGGPLDDSPLHIKTDISNNIYLIGEFGSSALFGTVGAIGYGGQDGFLAKYSPQGVETWVKTYGGTGRDYVDGIIIEANGEMYLSGGFENTSYMGAQTLASQGGTDGFLLHCDAQGNVLWARNIGGSGNESLGNLVVAPNGTLYSLINFNATLAFGSQILTAVGDDFLVLRHDSIGNVLWAAQGGGTGIKYVTGLVHTGNGKLAIGITFSGNVRFGSNSLTSRGKNDCALLHLQDNMPLSTRAQANNPSLAVYPNPASTQQPLRIELPATAKGTVRLLNTLGQVVRTQPLAVGKAAMSITGLAAGRYVVQVQTATEILTRGVVIE